MSATYTLEIDWNLDNSYTDESAYVRRITVDRGREHSITELRYSHVLTGRASIYLNNSDGRYNQYNTGGALYGYLLPFRRVRIKVDINGEQHEIFTSKIEDIRPARSERGDQYAVIRCVDGFDYLRNQKCDYDDLQTDYAVASAITDLLVNAGWDYADTSGWTFPTQLGIDSYLGSTLIENNGDEIPYWWSDPKMTVLGAIHELSDAFASDAYVSKDGTFAYAARRLDGVSLFTLTDSDLGAGSYLEYPWKDVRNKARVIFYPYKAESSAEIWRLTDVMSISASDTKTIYAEFQFDNIEPSPASSVVTPVSTTDYTANSQADGGGSDKTAQLGIVMTTYATHAKLELTNNDANTIYVTLLKLRGVLITARNRSVALDEDTDSSSTSSGYGPRTLEIDNKWMQTEEISGNHAGHIVTVYAEPRSIIWAELIDNYSKQFSPDLFDFVTVNSSEWSISNKKFMITNIKHDLQPGGNQRTLFRLEPAVGETLSYWYFPAQFGTSTYLGW